MPADPPRRWELEPLREREGEAVERALYDAPLGDLKAAAANAIAALDRVRDARGDDEAVVWRSMLDRIRIHGASGLWTGEDCAIGAVAALEGGDAGRAFMLERESARSPQDEDHKDGLPRSVWLCPSPWGHAQEFYVPHGGICPAAGCRETLVEYSRVKEPSHDERRP